MFLHDISIRITDNSHKRVEHDEEDKETKPEQHLSSI